MPVTTSPNGLVHWVASVRVLPVDGPSTPDGSAVARRPRRTGAGVPPAPGRPAGGLRPAPLPRAAARGDRRDARDPRRHGPIALALRHARTPRRPRWPTRSPSSMEDVSHDRRRSLARTRRSVVARDRPRPRRLSRAVEAALLRIETTPQERDLRIPRRFTQMSMPARVATAAVIGVLAVGGAFYLLGPVATRRSAARAGVTSAPSQTASARRRSHGARQRARLRHPARLDRLRAFRQAPDGSTTTMDTDRRQIWTRPRRRDAACIELGARSAGRPASTRRTSRPTARRSPSTTWTDQIQLWEADIDGAGSAAPDHRLRWRPDCSARKTSPPTLRRTRVAFVRGGEGSSVVGIRDLATGGVTVLESTRRRRLMACQTQPTWSPDGTQIAFARISGRPATIRRALSTATIFIVDVGRNGTCIGCRCPTGRRGAIPTGPRTGRRIVFSSLADPRRSIPNVPHACSPPASTGLTSRATRRSEPWCSRRPRLGLRTVHTSCSGVRPPSG